MVQRYARGRDMLDWIVAAGLVPENAPVRRVVIDAACDAPIFVYIELYGTDKMIRVIPVAALKGAKIEILTNEDSTSSPGRDLEHA